MSSLCSLLHQDMAETKALKKQFELAFEKAKASGLPEDREQVRDLKRKIEATVKATKERLRQKLAEQSMYLVEMDYEKEFPSFEQLKKEFSEGVFQLFDGRPFELDPSCEGVDETYGEKIFLVADPPSKIIMEGKKVIQWLAEQKSPVAPNGWRPATHRELYAFQKKYLINWLAALGSTAVLRGDRCVTTLRVNSYGKMLDNFSFNCEWRNGVRFLAVRK